MVQNDSANQEHLDDVPAMPSNPAKGIPSGKYQLVGWAIDTTGRRLIDEIIQIAAYTPQAKFSQYIMPFGDLNPVYSRRHGVRVVNTIRYRRLRDTNSQEFLKTKSEMSALQDFLVWLEGLKAEGTDGIVLVYHELRKASPGMLLESLRRNLLLERFSKVVKGFANGFNVAKAKCANATKSCSLRAMTNLLLDRHPEHFYSAAERARATLDISAHLAQSELTELTNEGSEKGYTGEESHFVEMVRPYANSIEAEEEEIALFKLLLERQNTFRPVFGALLRASRAERQHASHLRRLLAENNINFDRLKEAYGSSAKEGLEKVIKNEVANANEKEFEDLLEILDCFFDPEKKAVQPKPMQQRSPYRRRNNQFRRNKSSASESRSPTNTNENPTGSDETSPRSDSEKVKEVEAVEAATTPTPVAAQ
ncbi:unnamed protein product [Phyllotreta striolata]|uniref:Maternal protein exuperantia n=1 Tax=Phyllotreta striolata TaxID=444603 RepID=A0A9N9TK30_PHYSR|nr:unnamed protein product [Phyllotreta striolata]